MEQEKQLKIIYFGIIASFVTLSAAVIILKQVLKLPDLLDQSSAFLFLIPLIMILSILLAYGIYDHIAKKAKKTESQEEKADLFKKATIIKLLLIETAGTFANIGLFLYWRVDYLYILGITLVFFLLAYPGKIRYQRDFS